MDFGDGLDLSNISIPQFHKFVELDPHIGSFENDLKRRQVDFNDFKLSLLLRNKC